VRLTNSEFRIDRALPVAIAANAVVREKLDLSASTDPR
jgi:hypothetical protein